MKRILLAFIFGVLLIPTLALANPTFVNESIDTQAYNYTGTSEWNITMYQTQADVSDWDWLTFESNHTGTDVTYNVSHQIHNYSDGGQMNQFSHFKNYEAIEGTNTTVIKDGKYSMHMRYNTTRDDTKVNGYFRHPSAYYWNMSEGDVYYFWMYVDDVSVLGLHNTENTHVSILLQNASNGMILNISYVNLTNGWNLLSIRSPESTETKIQTFMYNSTSPQTFDVYIDEGQLLKDSNVELYGDESGGGGAGTYYSYNDSVTASSDNICARWWANETNSIVEADDWDCWSGGYPQITDCSVGIEAWELGIYEEFDDTAIGGTIESHWTFWNADGEGNELVLEHNGTDNETVCIFPNYTSGYVDADIHYYNYSTNESNQYESRDYYLRSASTDNDSSPLSLYLSPNTSEINYYIYDEHSSGIEGYIARFSRYFFGSDTYKLVDMGKSDTEGKGVLNLEQGNTYYRVEIYDNTTLIRTIDSLMLSDDNDDVWLYAEADDLIDVTKYWNSLTVTECAYNDTNMMLTCSVTDGSGEMVEATLDVWEYNNFTETLKCEDTDTGSSITLACNLSDTTDKNFRYAFYGSFCCSQETQYLFDGGDLLFKVGLGFGLTGLFVTLLLFIGSFYSVQTNPQVAVGLGAMAILLAYAVGLFSLTTGIIGFVVLTLAVLLILNKK